MGLDSLSNQGKYILGGKVNAMGTTNICSDAPPNIAAVAETGLPGYEVTKQGMGPDTIRSADVLGTLMVRASNERLLDQPR